MGVRPTRLRSGRRGGSMSDIRVTRPRALRAIAPIAAAILLAGAAHAAKKSNHVDAQWLNPDFAHAGVRTVAILPATTFDGNHQAENAVAASFASVFPDSSYLWIPAEETLRKLEAA